MEKFFYEFRPHAYIVLAIVVFFRLNDSGIALLSAALLLYCGITVLRLRQEYRESRVITRVFK